QYAKSVDGIAQTKDLKVIGLFDHGCFIFPRLTRYLEGKEDLSCSREYDLLREELMKNRSAPVVLAYSWDGYQNSLGEEGASGLLSFEGMDQYLSAVFEELSVLMDENGVERQYYLVGIPPRTSRSAFQCLAQ